MRGLLNRGQGFVNSVFRNGNHGPLRLLDGGNGLAVRSSLHLLLRLSALLCLHLRPHPLVRVLALFLRSAFTQAVVLPPDEVAPWFIELEVAYSAC